MSYFGYEKPEYFYCPKCGKKKLYSANKWVDGNYRMVWICNHNARPRRYSYRTRSSKERGEPCGLIISHPDRDAEISDYGGALQQLARITVPAIQNWLLENDKDVHKRAMEVLYEGELVDVVRRRHNDGGVGVALYWRGRTWDTAGNTLDPLDFTYDALRAESSQYLEFEGLSYSYIFSENGAVIWAPEDTEPFGGGKNLSKKTQSKIVSWVKRLEKALPEIIKQARSEQKRWECEQEFFERELDEITKSHYAARRALGKPIIVEHYNGHDKTASIKLYSAVVAENVLEIGKILNADIRVWMELGNIRGMITPELAIQLAYVIRKQQGLGVATFNINNYFYEGKRRVTLEEAKAIAEVLIK